MKESIKTEGLQGKPCFPWVGGKRRLVPILVENLPDNFEKMETYVEPFVGGGALFFWIRQNYPHIKCVICDANKDLINVYRILRDDPQTLIAVLKQIKEEYSPLDNDQRKEYFMKLRDMFNGRRIDKATSAGFFIFLMSNCFNGIYSVNRKGEMTVTFGRGRNLEFDNEDQLLFNSGLLKGVVIIDGDFNHTGGYATDRSFFYFDPPYKPVNSSSAYTAYMPERFMDPDQIRLADFCKEIHKKGVKWILSNSDPREVDENNTFFDDLYNGFNIIRTSIYRSICSIASKRKNVNELIIKNY